MITAIDHVVIVVRDLAMATRDFDALGFTVTPGGTHADGLTENALIAFADGSYLELLAFTDPERPVEHPWRARLDEGEGVEDFAVRSDDLDADVARWRAAGLQVSDPTDGGRRRPDGQEIRWRLARFTQAPGDAALPFVIQDETPRALRIPGGDATRHALPVEGVAGVTVALRALEEYGERYAALFGATQPQAQSDRLRVVLGQQWVDLVTPDSQREDLAERLDLHGEGPFALTLHGAGPLDETHVAPLDLSLTHDALIVVPLE